MNKLFIIGAMIGIGLGAAKLIMMKKNKVNDEIQEAAAE